MLSVVIAFGLIGLSVIVRIIRFSVLVVLVALVVTAVSGHGSAMVGHLTQMH
jgi:hypothetical protein